MLTLALELGRIWVREGGKSCVCKPQKEGRDAVNKINRAVSMKKAREDSKRCNIPEKREAEKSQSEKRS